MCLLVRHLLRNRFQWLHLFACFVCHQIHLNFRCDFLGTLCVCLPSDDLSFFHFDVFTWIYIYLLFSTILVEHIANLNIEIALFVHGRFLCYCVYSLAHLISPSLLISIGFCGIVQVFLLGHFDKKTEGTNGNPHAHCYTLIHCHCTCSISLKPWIWTFSLV